MGKMKKYRMLRLMSDNSKASLHEAKNVKKDERVMIKELKKKYYTQEDCNSNREVQMINKLKQENILKMLDMFHDDTELLMVFEYMPETIKSLTKIRGSFTDDESKGVMAQVLSGLAFIHKQGYIHCNLRPDNLVCNEEGTVVKISDFSTAKRLRDAPFGECNIKEMWYTAPECVMGSENYATPVDIWSVGCIMAEMLTGDVLLLGVSHQTQMQKICQLLGTFTKSEWPEGSCLLLTLNYKLPQISRPDELFANLGLEAQSDAKEFLLSMLRWSPQKRKSAKDLLQSRFLAGTNSGKSSNGGTNYRSNKYGDMQNGGTNYGSNIYDGQNTQQGPEIDRLETWRSRWGNKLASDSLEELDKILGEMSSQKHPQSNGHPYNPLLGDSSPRQGIQQSDNYDRGVEQRNNHEQQRNGFDKPRSALEDELVARQDKRGRKGIATDVMFPEDFGKTPRNDKNGNPGQTTGRQEDAMQQTPRGGAMPRSERIKKTNPCRYQSIYGKELRYVLGGKGDDGPDTDIYGNPNQINQGGIKNGGQPRNGTGGNSPPTFIDELRANNQNKQADNFDENRLRHQGDRFDNNGDSKQSDNGQQQRRSDQPLNDVKFIDHEAAARRLYAKSKVYYQDRYGNKDMRMILGTKPPGAMRFPDEDRNSGKRQSRSRDDDFHYTPTWAENGKNGRGTRN